MPNKKVIYDGKTWDEEEGPSGFVRLIRWATKCDVRYIEDLVEIDLVVYGEFLKKGWVKYAREEAIA
jgi:hypothetical protein